MVKETYCLSLRVRLHKRGSCLYHDTSRVVDYWDVPVPLLLYGICEWS